eukprot:scaffold7340_cov266-Pinguiococcus_pyrenoidosus.AAC.1
MASSAWVQTFDSTLEEYFYYNTVTGDIKHDLPAEGYRSLEEDRTLQAAVVLQSARRCCLARRRVAAARGNTNPSTDKDGETGVAQGEEYGDDDFDSDDYVDEGFEDENEDLDDDDDDDEDEDEDEDEDGVGSAFDQLVAEKSRNEHSPHVHGSFLELQALDGFIAAAREEAYEAYCRRKKALDVQAKALEIGAQKKREEGESARREREARKEWRRRIHVTAVDSC